MDDTQNIKGTGMFTNKRPQPAQFPFGRANNV